MALFLRCLCIALLLVVLPVAAQSQQTSDEAFDTHVARPMFKARSPKVFLDQGHHNTHTSRSRYDALAKLAQSDGFDVMLDNNMFSDEDLKEADILIIANPLGDDNIKLPAASNSAFTPDECNAVYRFIARGGSLLLVVEHAPMAVATRSLGERLGVNFSTGYLVDPALADTAFGASTLIFSQATGTLGNHVTMRGRGAAEQIQRIRTYTGQSLAGPPGSVKLLRVTDRAQDILLGPDGGKGPVTDSMKRSAAGRSQGLAFTIGKGRVVVLGETSMFAAQVVPGPGGVNRRVGMNAPGFQNRQFALNVLRWLGKGLNEPRPR